MSEHNEVRNKVLIVDDDSRNIFALSAVLKAKGYQCVTASSAEEGLRKMSDDSVGIVLLDMMMPDMDGYETLAVIRKGSFAYMPVVAVTAQAMVGDREKCLAAGADAYLSKPVDVDELIKLLEQYVEK